MKKEKTRKNLGLAFITLAISLMGILSYTLCYTCIRLYSMNYKEEAAAMGIGVIFMGTIIGLFYTVLITWKEFKEKGLLK